MTAPRPRIVIIGAGATGRGHIGQLAHAAGFVITFIERKKDLVAALRSAGRYAVVLAGRTARKLEIDGFAIHHLDEVEACAEAIAGADIVTTAVLPTNLESTVPTLAAGLELRRSREVGKPLNVIACENMERSSTTLRGYLQRGAPDLDWPWLDRQVGFPDAMVARAVPVPKDPLVLYAEAAQEISVDARQAKQPMPALPGLTLSENQEAALERKLYIKNTGHFAIGVLGYRKGYLLMDEAARDPEIFRQVDAATRESAAAVATKHGFDARATEEYRAAFLEGMTTPFLRDEVVRVIREPIRKLGREERLVGPALLACELARASAFAGDEVPLRRTKASQRSAASQSSIGPPHALAGLIAAVLTVVNPEDAQSRELQTRLRSEGLETVLEQICGIPRDHLLAGLIGRAYGGFRPQEKVT